MNSDVWLGEYEKSKYLRHRPDAALQQRLDEFTANIWSTDTAGNVIATPDVHRKEQLLHLIADVFFERARRDGSAPIELDETDLRVKSSSSYVHPILKTTFPSCPGSISKFGKREFISDALERGRFLIRPASYYDDPSLNPALKDKELEHYAVTPNKQALVKFYGLDVTGNEIEMPMKKLELFQYMMVPDL